MRVNSKHWKYCGCIGVTETAHITVALDTTEAAAAKKSQTTLNKCWTNNSCVNEKVNTHFRPLAKCVEKRMFV